MFDFLLNSAEQSLSLSDKLSIGGQVTLLGMGTVFAVLIVLWGMVELLHLILVGPTKKPKVIKVVEETTTPLAAEPETVPAPVAPQTDDLALIAVITAAVAAASGSSPSSFRVVSFKRANQKFSGK